MSIYWEDRGHCPKCGRFCGSITGYGGDEIGLQKVTGICKKHGLVNLTNQEWSYDDFWGEEED